VYIIFVVVVVVVVVVVNIIIRYLPEFLDFAARIVSTS